MVIYHDLQSIIDQYFEINKSYIISWLQDMKTYLNRYINDVKQWETLSEEKYNLKELPKNKNIGNKIIKEEKSRKYTKNMWKI